MNFWRLVLLTLFIAGCSPQGTSPLVETAAPQPETSAETTMMDPKDILFSMATINDAIPTQVEGSTVTDESLQIHEDDWRQFEFVSKLEKKEIAAELLAIDKIWKNSSVPVGERGTAFREMHVRKRIPRGLQIPMSLQEFEALVGQKSQPLTFYDYDEVLQSVHAVKIEDLLIYAQIQEGSLTTLGVDATGPLTLSRPLLDRLRRFVTEHDVVLVHWRSRTLLESEADIMAFFGASDE